MPCCLKHALFTQQHRALCAAACTAATDAVAVVLRAVHGLMQQPCAAVHGLMQQPCAAVHALNPFTTCCWGERTCLKRLASAPSTPSSAKLTRKRQADVVGEEVLAAAAAASSAKRRYPTLFGRFSAICSTMVFTTVINCPGSWFVLAPSEDRMMCRLPDDEGAPAGPSTRLTSP
jgi:hypothetical protein